MQPLETTALILFLLSYSFSGSYAIIAPDRYRNSEIDFYRSGKPGWQELLVFIPALAAFPVVLLHLIFEVPRLSEAILYGQVVLFVIAMPFHFQAVFRSKMVSTLQKKTDADYRKSGKRKLLIGAVMIALPLVIPY